MIGRGWELFEEVLTLPRTVVRLDQDTAWRLWTKGLEPVAARHAVHIEGDPGLGEPVLRAVAILA
jgi:hypothetical protein